MSTPHKPRRSAKGLVVIGWREWVRLPGLSPELIKAKIDTGARTSALHAFNIGIEERDGVDWVRFEIHPAQRSGVGAAAISCEVLDYRRVRSSTGHAERRPVIRTSLDVGSSVFDIDVTLTSRDEMGFRMLLGRSAVRGRYLVDPGRSFIQSKAHGLHRKGPAI